MQISTDHDDAVARLSNDHDEDVNPGNVCVNENNIAFNAWMEMILLTLQLLSFCVSEAMKRHVTCSKLFIETLLNFRHL